MQDDCNEADCQRWCGDERRNSRKERRIGQYERRDNPTSPTATEQLMLHLLQQQVPQVVSSSHASSAKETKMLAASTLSLSQIGSVIVVLVSFTIGGFSVWLNLNREIDAQRGLFINFKESISGDMVRAQQSIGELKLGLASLVGENRKSYDQMNNQIQDLDNSITQMYLKLNPKADALELQKIHR